MAELLGGPGPIPSMSHVNSTRVVVSIKPLELPVDDKRAARQILDEDIDQVKIVLQSMLRRRNELASISILPPEILAKIFIFARDANYYSCSFRFRWIRVIGHICHHWREVALSCPTLWSTPIFTNPELAQEMIRRSGMALLTIKSTTDRDAVNQLENAMAQLFRVQFLYLIFGSRKLQHILDAFSQPAPHLERVILKGSHIPHFLPEDAFVDAPRLRIIQLDNIHFSWESAIFKHNLTTLKLKNSPIAALGASTIGQMLEALAHMPDLHTLELINSIPSHTTVNGSELNLEFGALRFLIIDAKAPDCIQFLRCIKYPPHAAIGLWCLVTRAEDYIDIFALAGEGLQCPATTCRVFRSAKFSLSCSGKSDILLFHRPDTIMQSNPLPTVRIHFRTPGLASVPYDRIFRALCNASDLSDLESLELDWYFDSKQASRSIREGLGKLAKLNYIRVSQCTSALCSAIKESRKGQRRVPVGKPGEGSTQSSLQTKSRRGVMVFPALKTLVFQGADFDEDGMDNLFDVVEERVWNAPIDNIHLEKCRGVRTEHKWELAVHAIELLVDGQTVELSDLDSDSDVDS